MTVPSADGWTVRRRWIPRLGSDTLGRRLRRRTRGMGDRAGASTDLLELGDLADVPGVGWVAIVIALLGLLLFLAVVLLPLLVALAEVALLLALAGLAVVVRVLFRRPWLVDAHHGDGRSLRWRVVGWRASGDFAVEARQLLDAGIIPPGAEALPTDR